MKERITDILFLLSIVAPIVVVFWSIRNDKLGDTEKTTGLLAMKNPVTDDDNGDKAT